MANVVTGVLRVRFFLLANGTNVIVFTNSILFCIYSRTKLRYGGKLCAKAIKTFIMHESQQSISVDKYRALSCENNRFILVSAGLVSFQRTNRNHHLTHVLFSQINRIRDYERK